MIIDIETRSFIHAAHLMRNIHAPEKFLDLVSRHPEFLIDEEFIPFTTGPDKWFQINTLLREQHKEKYNPDWKKHNQVDHWTPDPAGDCEDKCLALWGLIHNRCDIPMQHFRLAICQLINPAQAHAVLIFRTSINDMILDPTRSSIAVDWRDYPAHHWLMCQAKGRTWQTFNHFQKETKSDD